MKLLNYENIKSKLLAPCQFHSKIIIIQFWLSFCDLNYNIVIDLWEPPKDNQSLSHLWELA
jgi:hypothetical protein